MLAFLLLAAQPSAPAVTFDVAIEGLRNARGSIHACLNRDPKFFPDCREDPDAVKVTIPATAPHIRFSDVAAGRYALTLFHDENDNGQLDMLLGIPREGFGFSRNPKVRFGAPKFNQVDFDVTDQIARQHIRIQYVL